MSDNPVQDASRRVNAKIQWVNNLFILQRNKKWCSITIGCEKRLGNHLQQFILGKETLNLPINRNETLNSPQLVK